MKIFVFIVMKKIERMKLRMRYERKHLTIMMIQIKTLYDLSGSKHLEFKTLDFLFILN